MTALTPRPWNAVTYANGAFDVVHDAATICARNPWNHRASESVANARLIAAAPDLLEVLIASLALIEHANRGAFENGVKHNGIDEGDVISGKIIDQARAAIAKATGVTS